MAVIKSERIGEEFFKINHKSGLTLLLYPKKEYSSAYALFGTKYGSIYTEFKTENENEYLKIPDGVAHFLEHKLFENENEDAFLRYAKTGASANAYTSFDKTAYLFSCTENFNESLEILLDFVTHPYFTEDTVKKEQGIIGQEIMMYEDDPDWRVFFNLLGALYQNHPVKIDIAGTKDTIAKITDKLLYRCYNAYYNLNNMALSVCGNFDPQDVIDAADRLLPIAEKIKVDTRFPEEPAEIAMPYVEEKLEVATPLFQLGFKEKPVEDAEFIRDLIMSEILVEIVAGESTETYRKMYESGIINATFACEVMGGIGYNAIIFSGESKNPQAVKSEIVAAVKKLREDGVASDAFNVAHRKVYGRYLRVFDKVDAIASVMLTAHFCNGDIYDMSEIASQITVDDINAMLKDKLHEERCALSVVIPKQ